MEAKTYTILIHSLIERAIARFSNSTPDCRDSQNFVTRSKSSVAIHLGETQSKTNLAEFNLSKSTKR
jgi:hypothetical protein